MKLAKPDADYLKEQLRNARAVLLTGAGFSADAKDADAKPLPLGGALAQEIWDVCFPGEPFDNSSSLADLYQHALARHRKALTALLQKRLTVSSQDLPDYYGTWLSMPWLRAYTLNVDDLETATARRFALPRPPVPVSGTTAPHGGRVVAPGSLEVIHLNGTLDDVPDNITFSTSQYGRRLASQAPAFHRLVGDLAGHPFVFVGTGLDESVLWQHIELRGERGGRDFREMRPRSFLISPTLSRARRELLKEFNVEWIPGSAAEFAAVLSSMQPQAEAGLTLLQRRAPGATGIVLVADAVAAANPDAPSFFLLGAEPEWRDIIKGRAISRTFDVDALTAAAKILDEQKAAKTNRDAALLPKIVLISGTAGAGKSASLMRAAMALSAAGQSVAWVGQEAEVSTRDLREFARAKTGASVLVLDDADRYGMELAPLLNDLQEERRLQLVLIAIRSSKVERALNPNRLRAPVKEMVVPGLSDDDIQALLHILDVENKLGILKGKTQEEKERAFRVTAGRQLLVAMLEATSGKRFEEKVVEEWEQLSVPAQMIYALIALASSFRHALNRDDVLLGVGDLAAGGQGNETLNALTELTKRHIVLANEDGTACRARHRHIADVLLNELQSSGRLGSVHVRLTYVTATKVSESMPRSAKPWRLLKSLINHDYLMKFLGLDGARKVYEAVEALLAWDYHYLLQRGSLEVEEGNINLAQNLLSQAYSLAPADPFVVTEYAYMQLRRAITSPGMPGVTQLVDDAIGLLEEQIETRGDRDRYPAHVLGSQVLAWTRRGGLPKDERERLLAKAVYRLEQSVRWHPREKDVQKLHDDVKREYLGLRLP